MSALTSSHYQARRYIEALLHEASEASGGSFEIDSSVQQYHRNDGYREVTAHVRGIKLEDLMERIGFEIQDVMHWGCKPHISVCGSARNDIEQILTVSIWNYRLTSGR